MRDAAGREAAYRVREAVFVDEQAVAPEIERDAADEAADHFVGYAGGAAVAAGRLVVTGERGILGRLAVLPATRRHGVGAALVNAIEQRARERGLAAVELHAQTHARAFYEALGYRAYGEEYVEAGIEHVSMRKAL